jgi:hypothetical protein
MRLTILDKCANLIVLQFIYVNMRKCDIWKDSSDAELEYYALEGMERLVMNRLYDYRVSSSCM